MAIIALESRHIPDAARLVADDVVALRRAVPVLPDAWEDPATVAKAMARLVERGAGLAVGDDGELVAFQAAITLDGHGGRWAYTPDIGHAAPGPLGPRLRERLYTDLAPDWLRAACPEHAITIHAHDVEVQAAMACLGFGQSVIDLVGRLDPLDPGPLPEGVTVRRAGPADAVAVAELDAALRRHLAGSPIFLRPGPAPSPEVARRELDDAAIATIVAERDGRAVAYLRIGPCARDVAMVVRDPTTASVTAAMTREELRGTGIASHLLDAALARARDAGYARWPVDHEFANREGGRFWARHATPAAVSMSRRLPPGLAL
jgi:GNAT superfamily N-acetyltransferase